MGVHASANLERSEDSFVEWVLSYLSMVLRDQTQIIRLGCSPTESCLASPIYLIFVCICLAGWGFAVVLRQDLTK